MKATVKFTQQEVIDLVSAELKRRRVKLNGALRVKFIAEYGNEVDGFEVEGNLDLAAAGDALDLVTEFLCDQETLKVPVRNEALCEKAKGLLAKNKWPL